MYLEVCVYSVFHICHTWKLQDDRFDYVTKTRMSLEINRLHAGFTFKLMQRLLSE